MASKTDVLEELKFLTDKLSTQVRTTALGVLVFAWGLLVGESAVARDLAERLKWHLVGVGALAVLALFLDFLQYLMGYLNVNTLFAHMEETRSSEGQYSTDSWSYKLRTLFFDAKILVLIVGVLWLLGALGSWLIATERRATSSSNQNTPALELRTEPRQSSAK